MNTYKKLPMYMLAKFISDQQTVIYFRSLDDARALSSSIVCGRLVSLCVCVFYSSSFDKPQQFRYVHKYILENQTDFTVKYVTTNRSDESLYC